MLLNTQSRNLGRIIKLLILAAIVLIGWTLYSSTKFHVVSTNPGLGNVTTVSPFLKINFNKPLSATSFSVSSNPPIIKSQKVDNKSITLNLNYPLDASRTYTITISRIADTSGHVITDKKFTFKPRSVPFKEIPKDQQKTLLEKQAEEPPSRETIAFAGTEALLAYGVTTRQVGALQQAFFGFAPSAKKVILLTDSISPVPHNPNSTVDTINFNVEVDNTPYKSRADYFDLTTVRLYLYNQSGGQVYDSKNVKL